eukprot:200537-Chlamydomonas_euryale.AAC.1
MRAVLRSCYFAASTFRQSVRCQVSDALRGRVRSHRQGACRAWTGGVQGIDRRRARHSMCILPPFSPPFAHSRTSTHPHTHAHPHRRYFKTASAVASPAGMCHASWGALIRAALSRARRPM